MFGLGDWSLVAFGVSGLGFFAWVLPVQRRLGRLTAGAVEDGLMDWGAFRRDVAWWSRGAHLATAAVLVAAALMVVKPQWPGV